MTAIYIRPLEEKDSQVSYVWRNDPKVWEFTGSRPDRVITAEIEKQWINKVLQDRTSRRFAICVKTTHQYIGNVQLTSIDETEKKAEFHIFIGERDFWGKGVATQATKELLRYAKNELNLKVVYLFVSPQNVAAVRAYQKNGFTFAPGSKTQMVCCLNSLCSSIFYGA